MNWGNFTMAKPATVNTITKAWMMSDTLVGTPVAACMVVYAVYTLRDRLPGRYAVLVLALFVGVQAFDLSAAAQQKQQKFAN